jgi:regulator of protease activity HflC (stomatin/prohibitin superfamily)
LPPISGPRRVLSSLGAGTRRLLLVCIGTLLGVTFLYGSCTARVGPSELGVMQRRYATSENIEDRVYGPGLYFVGPGMALHAFPRSVHILEASDERLESRARAESSGRASKVEAYFARRTQLLGDETHRTVDPLTVQTSDGYSVSADVTLLYSVQNPVQVAREFGLGQGYVDSFVVNTFRNGVLSTLGKLNAESFFHEEERIRTLGEAEALLRERFAARGFRVERLLMGGYSYAPNYEKSLHDKKVAVQLTVKNRKEGLVNEERAKLQQLDSKGTADITIAESQVAAEISKLLSEAELHASETRAKADREFGLAQAEAKRLKADALNAAGGRYVVALETAKMFDAVSQGVMTPEQYISFVRQSWQLVGLSPGAPMSVQPAAAPRVAGGAP